MKKTGSKNARPFVKNYRGSAGRAVVSFEYKRDWGLDNWLIS